jgi:GDPmannose 4,6-dehydratase
VFWQDKRVLITGINGFIGSHLTANLSHLGAEIYGFGRKKSIVKGKNQFSPVRQYYAGTIDDNESIAHAITDCEPEIIFHLAAQSSVADSFRDPEKTCLANCLGTSNLLQAVHRPEIDPVIVFAGSSDEYGLVFSSASQYHEYVDEYGEADDPPVTIPEIPIPENNPLRPLSPYAVSKVYGDLLMRNFHKTYGMKSVVCRSFNVEGAGRGDQYVTSVIAQQVAEIQKGNSRMITIGNINPVRDFSHVCDVVRGYLTLAEKGRPGNAYNLGSMRGVSIASYLLTCLTKAGYPVDEIRTEKGDVIIPDPLAEVTTRFSGSSLAMTSLDLKIISGEVSFSLEDKGISVNSGDKKVNIHFDPGKFRPADIPVLIADTRKISKIGYKPKNSFQYIVREQLQSYQSVSD